MSDGDDDDEDDDDEGCNYLMSLILVSEYLCRRLLCLCWIIMLRPMSPGKEKYINITGLYLQNLHLC